MVLDSRGYRKTRRNAWGPPVMVNFIKNATHLNLAPLPVIQHLNSYILMTYQVCQHRKDLALLNQVRMPGRMPKKEYLGILDISLLLKDLSYLNIPRVPSSELLKEYLNQRKDNKNERWLQFAKAILQRTVLSNGIPVIISGSGRESRTTALDASQKSRKRGNNQC